MERVDLDLSRRLAFYALLVIVILVGPGLVSHARLATDPWIVNDDALQQVWPLYRLMDPTLFSGDVIASYYLNCMPVGFRGVYAALGTFIAPAAVSRILPYVLLAVLAAAAGLAGFRLAGRFGALTALLFVLGTPAMLERMTGGLARAFGYPLLAGVILFVVRGRPLAAAITVVLSIGFYPSVTVIGGIVLACCLLVPDLFDSSLGWSRARRLALLGVTALAAVAVHVPTARSCAKYGPGLTASDLSRIPELGSGGRYLREDRPPFDAPSSSFLAAAMTGIMIDSELVPEVRASGFARAGLFLLVAGAMVGALLACRRNESARRLWLFPLAALLSYWIASAIYPRLFIPTRYPALVMPLFAPLMIVTGLSWLAGHLPSPAHMRRVALIATGTVVTACSLLVPTASVATSGWTHRVPPEDIGFYAFVAGLPKSVRIAGWPGPGEPVESVPYFTLRSAYLTWETHQVFLEAYTLEMRRRMELLIRLFVDGDVKATTVLRDLYGVTHVVVGKGVGEEKELSYMEPFGTAIRARPSRASTESIEAALQESRLVYQDRKWRLFELRRVPPRE